MRKKLTGVLLGLVIGCFMVAGHAFATGNVVPITDSTETLGTSTLKWGEGNIDWLRLESDDTIKNETDDTFDFASNDTNTILRVVGYEASYAQITLDADEGDDNADSFHLRATAANALEIYNHSTKIWSISSAGAVNQVGGINCDEDVDIDFDATDEEMNVTSSVNPDGSAGAGMVTLYDSEDANGANAAYLLRLARKNDGGANNHFILCEDNSTGAAGNGDDMFKVDDAGDVTCAGDIDIDGDGLTSNGDLLITPGGTEVHIAGGMHVGGTDAVGDNNLKVDGTAEITGVATLTAQPVCNAGLDVNEDVDIDFDANDEEWNLTAASSNYAAGAGLVTIYASHASGPDNDHPILRLAIKADGDAQGTFLLCEDNSTGAAANGDDMFKVGSGGAVTAAGAVDAANFTCDAGAGLDAQSAGAVDLGAATATSVQIGATDITTHILGGMDCRYQTKTTNYTVTSSDFAVSYTTSATTTNTLPEASTVLGSVFCIGLYSDGGDLVVMTDGTDKFDGAGNDILTFADAGDSCIVMATAANAYTILCNVGGTLSD